MDWKNNLKTEGYKILYKGVDVGLTVKLVH